MRPPAELGFRPAESHAGRQFVLALRSLPEAMVVVRDDRGIMLECNDAYAAFVGLPASELIGKQAGTVGTTPQSKPFIFKYLRPVFEQNMEATHWLLIGGRRHLARAWPLSREEWATPGYAAVIIPTNRAGEDIEAGLSTERTLGPLEDLSPTELAVLYHFAKGLTRTQIAQVMSRSEHTVHEHFKGIHAKMNISRQQDLAALVADLGLRGFTPHQWRLLTGAPV
ncbi:MAG TPA: LuxR C-terminal-related transcriptional regulator [Phycisphaerales bacterium]|nr:LuxR C-terminal-related transcriptional regulator [Phycisphaerales bacterium]